MSESPAVNAITISGNTIYVGGEFAQIGGQQRENIAALDATIGNATTWSPGQLQGKVFTIIASGNTVYVGGNFDQIGGQSREGLAALDITTGNVTAWNPDPTGVTTASTDGATTSSLAIFGNTIYAGGGFLRWEAPLMWAQQQLRPLERYQPLLMT